MSFSIRTLDGMNEELGKMNTVTGIMSLAREIDVGLTEIAGALHRSGVLPEQASELLHGVARGYQDFVNEHILLAEQRARLSPVEGFDLTEGIKVENAGIRISNIEGYLQEGYRDQLPAGKAKQLAKNAQIYGTGDHPVVLKALQGLKEGARKLGLSSATLIDAEPQAEEGIGADPVAMLRGALYDAQSLAKNHSFLDLLRHSEEMPPSPGELRASIVPSMPGMKSRFK